MASSVPQSNYKGRVRTGCLTCRSRKVKCDEGKPTCTNCVKVKRVCAYKPARVRRPDGTITSASSSGPRKTYSPLSAHNGLVPDIPGTTPSSPSSPNPSSKGPSENTFRKTLSRESPRRRSISSPVHEATYHSDSVQYSEYSTINVLARLERTLQTREVAVTNASVHNADTDNESSSALISRNIEITTTMDILAASDPSEDPLLSFFIDSVDCPPISVYDDWNWQQMKLCVVERGKADNAVASAIIALSMLVKTMTYSLPFTKALSLYQSAKSAFTESLSDEAADFDKLIVIAFLVALFEYFHYDLEPSFALPNDTFLARLATWETQGHCHSWLSTRIIIWFELLYATTLRGGGEGLIGEDIRNALPRSNPEMASFMLDTPSHVSAQSDLCAILSAPLLNFHRKLQNLSAQIAKSTHYHRSRYTGTDQEEVVAHMDMIRKQLHELWDTRSATQCQTPSVLRSYLAPEIAEPTILLIGVCAAAYHAEIIEIGRVLGDPITELTDSKQAMLQIQELIDGDWNAYNGLNLNAGYLRPLFLCAIESMDVNTIDWAVNKIKQIRSLTCRSDFFAAFAKALSEAQLRKGRRVTSKYFCVRQFRMTPPYL